MDPGIFIDILGWLGSFVYKAVVIVVAVAMIATVTMFVAENTLIKRYIMTDMLPMWSMLMVYFLTMEGRLNEIERTSAQALRRLGVFAEDADEDVQQAFPRDMWRETKPGSTRHELKRSLQESSLGPDETRSLFAPVVSALLKLKNDAELFRAYSNHLSDKMESLWSEKLQLVHAGGGGVESVFVLSKEAEALHFYISRHLEILLLYLNRYIAGDRDYITAENIANYWPYFLGQPDRLLVTAREDFLHGHLGDRERKTLTLRGRVEFIEEALAEAREEIGHKIKKELPKIEVATIWGR
ncbi:MAG: hypothetical protein QNL90_03795 [Gammaproteobacteria bacterium]|nr:hypothetical protein [Gammaproteobacteria bacterium]MDX2459228.1 hypothetical protein [Gammaproteobacteria bacterium]